LLASGDLPALADEWDVVGAVGAMVAEGMACGVCPLLRRQRSLQYLHDAHSTLIQSLGCKKGNQIDSEKNCQQIGLPVRYSVKVINCFYAGLSVPDVVPTTFPLLPPASATQRTQPKETAQFTMGRFQQVA